MIKKFKVLITVLLGCALLAVTACTTNSITEDQDLGEDPKDFFIKSHIKLILDPPDADYDSTYKMVLETIETCYAQFLDESKLKDHIEYVKDNFDSWWKNRLNREYHMQIIKDKNRVIGMTFGYANVFDQRIEVLQLYVHPNYQHRHIETHLMFSMFESLFYKANDLLKK